MQKFLAGERETFVFRDRRTMNTVLQIVREEAVLIFLYFVWQSSVLSAKFEQMHAAVRIMAADNYVPQFPKESARMFFGK